MKFALLLAVVTVLCTTTASAQDRIELYADENMSTCTIFEPVSPPIVQVHVFITGTVPARGARFTARKPDCWLGAIWLGDALSDAMSTIGNSQGDWSIAWSVGSHCETSNSLPIHIGAISYQISGQALPCCRVDALPSVQFAFVDCNFEEIPLEETKPILVNPDESCGCQAGVLTAVENTSWGRVKALYH